MVCLGSSASAADLPLKAPPPMMAAPSWTGFYLGVNAGGSLGLDTTTHSAMFTSTALGNNGLLNSSERLATVGWIAGAQVGYNWQVSPRWVLGLEADGQWSSQRNSAITSTPFGTLAFFGAGANGFGFSAQTEQKVQDFGTARARAGMLFGNSLFYGTGGFAWGTVKDSYSFVGTANPQIFTGALQPGLFLPSSASFSDTRTGWTAGAGVETGLGGGWTAKLEYLYVDLGKFSHSVPIAINPGFGAGLMAGAVANATMSSHVADNIVRLGVNYQFYR